MSKTSPTWCPFLFHSIMITPYSQVRPCCRFDPTVYESGFSWRNKETLDDFYNKEIFNSLREQAASGQKVLGCHRCYREEALGIPSMRQKSFPAAIPQEDNSDHSSLKIAVLELGVGRVCNLKCRSCDSYFSTKWDSDAKTLNFSMPEPGVNIDLDLISDELLKNVTVLKITGGEPCLSPAFHKFLNRLANSNIASQIELEIFTNATIAPPQPLVSTLPHFKKVNIRLSIDAVGTKNTYIRHPSDWEKIHQICEQWFQIQASSSQLSVGFANTISIFNILDIFEFIAWTRTFNQKPHPNIIFQTVHDPLYLSVACLPQKIRQNIYSLFTKQWQEHKQITENTPLEGKLTQIAKLLTDSTEDTNYLTDFYRITSQIDKLRGESFSQTFPELDSILNFSDYKTHN